MTQKLELKLKRCPKCHEPKELHEFWKASSTQDGLQHWCKVCMMEHQVIRYKKQMADEERMKHENPNEWERIVALRLWRDARKRSNKLDKEFRIVPEDIKVSRVCPILGVPLFRTANTMSRNSPSLDRVDGSLGYIPGNIRVISWLVNNVKSNLTTDEVERLLLYMKGFL